MDKLKRHNSITLPSILTMGHFIPSDNEIRKSSLNALIVVLYVMTLTEFDLSLLLFHGRHNIIV